MKKLVVLFIFLMFTAGCSLSGQDVSPSQTTNANQPQTFICEKGCEMTVMYSEDGGTAYLHLTMPQANLKDEDIELKIAVSGSGSRYVSEPDSEILYEWHVKGDTGILSVDPRNGEKYTSLCDQR